MKKKFSLKPYLFILPSLVIAITFLWLPSIKSIFESFFSVNQSGKILSFSFLNNYISLFKDSAFINSLKVTLKFTLIFLPINTFVTLLSVLLTRNKSRLGSICEYVFFLPLSLSLSGFCIIFKELFKGKASVFNELFHLNFMGLQSPLGALIVLVIISLLLDFGVNYILLLSSFRSEDKDIIEAGELDGVTPLSSFFLIELPMAKETIIATIFLALKNALLISQPVIILTEGGPFRTTETMMFYYYIEAFKSGNRGIQNALTSLIILISGVLMFLLIKRRKR